MITDKMRGSEIGMIRGLLGYQLLTYANEDLVLHIRKDSYLYTINQLKEEGWDILEAICIFADEDPDDILIAYRVSSQTRLHTTISLQVRTKRDSLWSSAREIFPNAKKLEDGITELRFGT